MKISVANQGYLVYVFFGIIIAVTPFIKIALPISISDYNQAFYDVIENAPEGAWVVGASWLDYFNARGGLRGATFAYHKHALYDKGLKIFHANFGIGHANEQLTAFTLGFYEEFLGVPLNESPLYGTQIVYLGYLPIPQENAYTSFVDNIYGVKLTDHWGTPLEDLPMFQGEDAISSWSEAYAIMGWQDIEIALFPELKKIFIADDSWLSYGSAVFATGQVAGFIGGMRGGAEYEILTTYIGECSLVMIQSFFSAGFVVIAVIIGSVWYLVKRNGGQK